jgi:hypothetical protein
MADDRVLGALEFIQEQVTKLLADAAEKKRVANSLALTAGLDPPYTDIEDPDAIAATGQIGPDQFANHKAPSTAARAYLEAQHRPATVDVIYRALVRGGFTFGSTNQTDAKNGLRIALGKDILVRRLANEHYGLWEWYPNAKRDKPKKSGDSDTSSNGDADTASSNSDEANNGSDGEEESP